MDNGRRASAAAQECGRSGTAGPAALLPEDDTFEGTDWPPRHSSGRVHRRARPDEPHRGRSHSRGAAVQNCEGNGKGEGGGILMRFLLAIYFSLMGLVILTALYDIILILLVLGR